MVSVSLAWNLTVKGGKPEACPANNGSPYPLPWLSQGCGDVGDITAPAAHSGTATARTTASTTLHAAGRSLRGKAKAGQRLPPPV